MENPISHIAKRKDITLAGAVFVLAQVMSGFYSNNNLNSEIEKLKEEFKSSLYEREEFFVRKTDLNPLSVKLDDLKEELATVKSQLGSLKRSMTGEDFSAADGTNEIVGCSFEGEQKSWKTLKL